MIIEDIQTYRDRIQANSRCLHEYINVVGYYMGGHLEKALDRVRWIADEYDLEGFPDIVMAEVSLRQSLPLSNPGHRQPTSDDLSALYQNRSAIGSMRRTVFKMPRGVIHSDIDEAPRKTLWPHVDLDALKAQGRLLPDDTLNTDPEQGFVLHEVAAAVSWPEFALNLHIVDDRTVAGAWALNRTLAGEYEHASEILDAAGTPDNAVLWAASMALYYLTQRWGDLRDVANQARNLTPHVLGVPAGVEHLEQEVQAVVDLALFMAGAADASLGDTALSRASLMAATQSASPAISAKASYVLGLTYRPGDETTAAQHISRAAATFHDAEFDRALRDTDVRWRVTSLTTIATRSDKWDISTEDDPEMERKRQVDQMRDSYKIRADKLLEDQIGMEDVKTEVRKLITNIRVSQERIRRGGSASSANYNLVLTGPPGTGKSTIVDVITLHMAALGIVDDPKPVVTHRENFVAGTVGGTATKTIETIESAVGKVLFIDEFYALVQQADGPNMDQFGKEALDTIVAESETRIGQMVFIIAGYEADINRVVRINEGLSSRFPRRINFRHYSLEEIALIAEAQARRSDMKISPEAMEFLADENGPARHLLATDDHGVLLLNSLGNGRFARNLVETATEFMSLRLAESNDDLSELDNDSLFTLTKVDIEGALQHHITTKLAQ